MKRATTAIQVSDVEGVATVAPLGHYESRRLETCLQLGVQAVLADRNVHAPIDGSWVATPSFRRTLNKK